MPQSRQIVLGIVFVCAIKVRLEQNVVIILDWQVAGVTVHSDSSASDTGKDGLERLKAIARGAVVNLNGNILDFATDQHLVISSRLSSSSSTMPMNCSWLGTR